MTSDAHRTVQELREHEIESAKLCTPEQSMQAQQLLAKIEQEVELDFGALQMLASPADHKLPGMIYDVTFPQLFRMQYTVSLSRHLSCQTCHKIDLLHECWRHGPKTGIGSGMSTCESGRVISADINPELETHECPWPEMQKTCQPPKKGLIPGGPLSIYMSGIKPAEQSQSYAVKND